VAQTKSKVDSPAPKEAGDPIKEGRKIPKRYKAAEFDVNAGPVSYQVELHVAEPEHMDAAVGKALIALLEKVHARPRHELKLGSNAMVLRVTRIEE
jgi:hypothetical protein